MNRFDYFIIVIFITLLFGLYGAGLQPIRILVFILTIMNISYIFKFFSFKKHLYLFFMTFFLILYSFFSIFFVFENFINNILAWVYFTLNVLLFVNFVCCVEFSKKPIYSIQIGSLFFCSVAVLYGIYEINTGNHLSVSFLEGEKLSLRSYSSFTFGNYNAFVLALMVNLPILVYSTVNVNINLIRFFSIFLLLGVAYLILINGSRSGLIGLILTALYIYFFTKKVWIKGFLITLVFAFLSLFLSKFDFLSNRLSEMGLSDNSRSAILYDVFPTFFKQGMIGFGIGNFSYYAENILHLELYAPHNFFLEILFELGIISFILILLLFVKILSSSFFQKNNRFYIFYMLLLFIPFSVLNSGYLLTAIVWLFLGLIYSFSISKVT